MQPAHTFTWQHPFVNDRFRILFVEDDLFAVKTVRKILEKAGYLVHTATNINDARTMLDEMHIHLGIFDLNLARESEARDDSQPQNRDGLELAVNPHFPLLRMVYTGEEDYQVVVETLEHPQAVNYIVKGKDSEAELVDKVALALSGRLMLNQDLTIHWENTSLQSLVQTIYPHLSLGEQLAHLYELEDCFRMQFFGIGQEFFDFISVETIPTDKANRVWLKVSAYTQRGRRYDSLVLCGERDLVMYEAEQFDKLSPRSGQMRTPPTQTVHYGLHAYDIFSERLQHIHPLTHAPLDRIGSLLPQLQQERFSQHHRNKESNVQDTLYQLAIGPSDESIWDVTEAGYEILSDLANEWQQVMPHVHLTIEQNQVIYGYNRTRHSLPNPFMYLAALGTLNVMRPVGWVHGNLCLSSIFADLRAGDIYLLDYTNARYASILRDYVTLERSVHLHILNEIDIDDYAVFTTLLNPESDASRQVPALQRAGQLIQQIRAQAMHDTECSLGDYLLDLYMALVDYLMTYPQRPRIGYKRVRQYAHCFLFAGQVCQALQAEGILRVDKDQPQDGIWIDKERLLVRRLGKHVTLTEKQFGIFELLYDGLGEECTYVEIIKEGLGEDLVYNDITLDKPRIHTAVSRLRLRLQPLSLEIESARDGYRMNVSNPTD